MFLILVLDVIKGILGRGQSGRLFTEIRSKKGLAYDVGIEMVHDTTFGFAGAYATIDRKNQTKVKKMILEELAKLSNASPSRIQLIVLAKRKQKLFKVGSKYIQLYVQLTVYHQ